mgnify:CR=1 FL=1
MNSLGPKETFSELTISEGQLICSGVMKEFILRSSNKRLHACFECGADFSYTIQSKKSENRSLCIVLFDESEKNWLASL